MPVRLPPPLQLCVRQEHGQEKGRGSNEAGEEEDDRIVELLHDALAQTGERPKEMDYLRGVLRRRVLQVNPEIDKFAAAVRAAAKQGFLLEKSERPALFEEAGR